jgi:hypothetical protein
MNARMDASSLFVVTRTNVTRVDADDDDETRVACVRGRVRRRCARDGVVKDGFESIMMTFVEISRANLTRLHSSSRRTTRS